MSNPNWIRDVYGQDLTKAYPAAIQNVGGVSVLIPSLQQQLFNLSFDGGEATILTPSSYDVQSTDAIVVAKLSTPGTITLNLPATSTRNGLILGIADWNGNATINLVPSPGELIMGLATGTLISSGQGLGTGVSVYIRPVTSLAGWINI